MAKWRKKENFFGLGPKAANNNISMCGRVGGAWARDFDDVFKSHVNCFAFNVFAFFFLYFLVVPRFSCALFGLDVMEDNRSLRNWWSRVARTHFQTYIYAILIDRRNERKKKKQWIISESNNIFIPAPCAACSWYFWKEISIPQTDKNGF